MISEKSRSGSTVKFDLPNQDNFKNVESNLAIARESQFNQKYNDYVIRVQGVNRAKKILRQNRLQLDKEVKREMINHIRRTMKTIEKIERELELDGVDIMRSYSDPQQNAATSSNN